MRIDDMSIHTLRKRFVNDHSLPIQVLQSPYFDYFIDLYETLYQSRTNYARFMSEVEHLGGEEAYLSYYNQVKDNMITHVKQKEAFQQFNQTLLSEFHVKTPLPKRNLYQEENNGMEFVSIDLQKANFHALRYYDETMVDGKETYEAWIEQFTPLISLGESKYLRQVIFGNLNPKKQQKIQQFITHSFVGELGKMLHTKDIISASHDEIILLKKEEVSLEEVKKRLEDMYQGAFPLHVDAFRLEKFTAHPLLGYIKHYEATDKMEFKGIASHFMAQAYRYFHKQPLKEEDLVFFHEGQIAQFKTPLLMQKAD